MGTANLWKNYGSQGWYALLHGPQLQPVSNFPPPEAEDRMCPSDGQNSPACILMAGAFSRVGGLSLLIFLNTFSGHFSTGTLGLESMKHSLAFGISQCPQALNSPLVQMKLHTLEPEAHTIATVTVEKLDLAKSEEESGLLISDEASQCTQETCLSHGRWSLW